MQRARPLGRAFDLLLPPCCVLCSRTVSPGEAPVCPGCWHRLPPILHPRCRRCGATTLTPAEGGGCPACAAWPLESLCAASIYRMEGDAARLVRSLKYRGWTALAAQMGAALERPARELLRRAAAARDEVLLVPVPIAPSRLRERGFNQAELLARALGKVIGSATECLLARSGVRRAQARLARRDRLAIAGEGFTCVGAASASGRPVLLVDDVVTTGATAAACVAALATTGYEAIGLVSFARAWRTLEPSGISRVRM